MEARKKCREEAATAHLSVLSARKDLEAKQAKFRRLEAKVNLPDALYEVANLFDDTSKGLCIIPVDECGLLEFIFESS